MTAMSRLPSRFPVGTRFVVEGQPGKDGRLQIVSRYLVMPNGTEVDLMARRPKRPAGKARSRPASARRAG
jgi:hypothetical protein